MAANILVVEDDRLNRQLISKVLRREGYQVVEACDGARIGNTSDAAVRPCDYGFYDAKVERTQARRAASRFSATPSHNLYHRYLSIISGEKILDEVAEVLPKPFEIDVLRSTVQRLLRDSASC